MVQSTDLLDLVLGQIEAAHIQVLRQTVLVIALGNDSNAPLRRPPQQDLRRGLAVLVRNALDGRVLKKKGGILRLLHVQLEERLGSKGRVCCHGNVPALAKVQEILLDEVWVMLDLKGLRHVLGVSLDVKEEGPVVVADSDGLDEALLIKLLHGVIGLLERGLAEG